MERHLLIILCVLMFSACDADTGDTASSPDDVAEAVAALPQGDVSSGEALFGQRLEGAPACSSCHQVQEGRTVGPGLAHYPTRAEDQVAALNAAEYTYQSIVQPEAFVVEGYADVMYRDYDDTLSEQELADLIAYLLSLN